MVKNHFIGCGVSRGNHEYGHTTMRILSAFYRQSLMSRLLKGLI